MSLTSEPANEVLEGRRGEFPGSLKNIPLSEVSAVASLPDLYLNPLERAYASGNLDLPRAIQFINNEDNPFITAEEILEAASRLEETSMGISLSPRTSPNESIAEGQANQAPPEQPKREIPAALEESWDLPLTIHPTQKDVDNLVELLRLCYGDMNRISAESLVESQMFRETLGMVTLERLLGESKFAKTEYLLLTQVFMLNRIAKTVIETIQSNPALKTKLEQREQLLDILKIHL